MRKYEKPEQHFERHMDRAAKKYHDGLQKAGLEPNAKLTSAIAERAAQEAGESYLQEAGEVRDHNIAVIMHEHGTRLNAIKRSSHQLRLKICPPIALFFGLLAWYNFTQPDGFPTGICYVLGALAFLAMLILGAIFDRPKE